MKFENEQYILVVNEKDNNILHNNLSALSKQEIEHVSTINNENRKIEFVQSRLLLREILGTNYKEVSYEKSGKPIMDGTFISISHSKSYVAVIVSKTHSVAVDIEEFRQQVFRITEKFVRAEESKEFSSLEDLILLWSAKETLFKLTNASYDLLDFSVKKDGEEQLQGSIILEGKQLNDIKLSYFRNDKFCLVWASEKM
ncbi:MAG: 4'-phosphopantetheinyl transferase superfamily protein [Bacteroidales bacterium]|nr:4'-phosphopantetheinyl transferase superfamily protein [Bacteroidales bacterium]